ncbi:MAG TPA: 5-(carboxyamino)imidazole ribonucleotide synthase [Candidatus Saccharimonadales bacterium]|nr:5-(carboxyamino)imidazole ribonucleotide synthase [Candidatus Saccharimonadales bacterium]
MKGQETIGIIGGGQLGRMLTLAALPLGFNVVVVDPTPHSPAAQVGAEQIVADLYDQAALQELAKRANHITIEIEHLDADALDTLASQGVHINPAPATIRLIQDKFAQKRFLHQAGVPVAPFGGISTRQSAEAALKTFGGRMLIKTRHGAYDGRGNMVVRSSADIDAALKAFKGRKLYAEAYVPFVKELAVMVARGLDGSVALYPVVETIHERNICLEVIAPAQVDEKVRKQAEQVALRVASLLKGAGMFGIEMFLTKDDRILVNEIAPRVHNSGHYSIEANRTSQFEQHIRAVSGLPLGSTELVVPVAVMINILGERDGPTELKGLADVLAMPFTSVHIYGKSPTKVDRKMGHITVTGKTPDEVRKRALSARKKLSI